MLHCLIPSSLGNWGIFALFWIFSVQSLLISLAHFSTEWLVFTHGLSEFFLILYSSVCHVSKCFPRPPPLRASRVHAVQLKLFLCLLLIQFVQLELMLSLWFLKRENKAKQTPPPFPT